MYNILYNSNTVLDPNCGVSEHCIERVRAFRPNAKPKRKETHCVEDKEGNWLFRYNDNTAEVFVRNENPRRIEHVGFMTYEEADAFTDEMFLNGKLLTTLLSK